VSQQAQDMAPAEVLTKARAWYTRQLEILQRCHGARWPEHRHWVEAYLQEELRQRLIARGWRLKR
jgi:hypothetical protein